MDTRGIAADAGYLLAQRSAAYSTIIESRITQSTIYPHPVRLEPPFTPFDPLLTFAPNNTRPVHRAKDSKEWVVHRLILPRADNVDWARAEAHAAGLSGIKTSASFEVFATRDEATFYLGSPRHHASYVAHNYRAAYPDGAIVSAPDPWRTLAADALIIYDLYSRVPYQRSMRTRPPTSPWSAFLQLCQHLESGEFLIAQVPFTACHHPWHQNINALLLAEQHLGARSPLGRTAQAKNISEPLFAAAIRVGTNNHRLAPLLEAFCGTFVADGTPFAYRTSRDFRRVLTRQQLHDCLRKRTSHTTGQLLTSSELSVFLHPLEASPARTVRVAFLQGLGVPTPLQRNGILLGTNEDRGEPTRVFQPLAYNQNTWVLGASGKGKSNLLKHVFCQRAKTGGVGLIDPHRTSAFDVLGMLNDIPIERIAFLDFDASTPVAYNPFANHDPAAFGRLTTEYVNCLKSLFAAERYHRMLHVLANGLFGLFVLGENLATLPDLLARNPAGESLRRRLISECNNQTVKDFWSTEYHQYHQTRLHH